MAPLTVGYWKIRGLGAPLRMICEYAGAEYEATCYELGKDGAGNWDNSAWMKDAKPALKAKNAFMNLPYIVDGDVVVSQTIACLSFLGKKYSDCGLYGSSAQDALKIDQVLCEAQDLRNAGVAFFYGGDTSTPQDFVEARKGSSYQKFELWLEQQGTLYTAGQSPTIGDFHLWEMLDQIEMFAQDHGLASPLAAYPKLNELYKALKAEPKLAKYFGSDLYKLPPNNKMAVWGSGASTS